ncbi:MAG: MFS transporter [Planctomycetales bacterium]
MTADLPPEPSISIYRKTFWLSYLANTLVVTANALTFRFAEFVAFLGGTEELAGQIVSTGVIGAVLSRFVLGQAIDRYGTRRLWILSSICFTAVCPLFLLFHTLSWSIYAARILYSASLAGMLSCSIVHIQNQAPPHRRTEIIGSLGSSGFIGMIAGPMIGDLIFRRFPGQASFTAMFLTCGLLAFGYLLIVMLMTRDDEHRAPADSPYVHHLLVRHWPGPIAWVAILLGVNFTIVSVFLTRFATHLGFKGMSTFFLGYSCAAFLFRIVTNRWAALLGRHKIVLIGSAGLIAGQFLLPWVTREWHFLLPALLMGFGHALLFPVIVSLGSGAFPVRYRGSGTTIILGLTEMGTVLSAPILGAIIDRNHETGFINMFLATGTFTAIVAVYYALTAARTPDLDRFPHEVLEHLPVRVKEGAAETTTGEGTPPSPSKNLCSR